MSVTTQGRSGVGAGGLFVRAIVALGLLGVGAVVYQSVTQSDERIVQMLVEVSDVDGKAASANVVAHTVSNLTGRMTWQDGPVSKTWSETLRISPHESLEVYIVASPLTPRGKRRAVTCYLKVTNKNVPGSPNTVISYPTDSSKECAINFLIPPLVR